MLRSESQRLGPRTSVIDVGMQKGGVAKTTNALHLAGALAEKGRRVLLWDVDENYGATKVLGFSDADQATTMEVVAGEIGVLDAIRAKGEGAEGLPSGLDFIPSSRALQGLERVATKGQGRCLEAPLRELRALGRYDYIVLDTGPHASATTRSAYLASDYFILSTIPEKQAIGSLPDALIDIRNARRPGRNPDLHLLGLILARVDRRISLHKEYERKLAEGFLDGEGRRVKFETSISAGAVVDQAYTRNQLTFEFAPSHRVSEQYRALAAEVEDRIGEHSARKSLAAGSEIGQVMHG